MVDEPDFTEFVAARSTALLRSAYLLTGNWATAEDLLQTTLAKCWRSWARMSGDPEPYVRKAMVNTYLSWLRRRWGGEAPTSEIPDAGVDDDTGGVDERDALWLAMHDLPRRQRAVLVLRYFDDLSEQETGRLLGISVGTVKSQTSKALHALRVDTSLHPNRIVTEMHAHAAD